MVAEIFIDVIILVDEEDAAHRLIVTGISPPWKARIFSSRANNSSTVRASSAWISFIIAMFSFVGANRERFRFLSPVVGKDNHVDSAVGTYADARI
jgi:hypothetical protein